MRASVVDSSFEGARERTRTKETMDHDDGANDDALYDSNQTQNVFLESDSSDPLIAGKQRRDTEVFIGSIALEASEKDVHAALRKCEAEAGATGFELMMDRTTNKHRGYAFARYDSPESANAAIKTITEAECEVKKQKIRASMKPNKYRVFVGGLRRDATREEVIEALRTRGAGLEYFELAKPKRSRNAPEDAPTDHNGGCGWAIYYNEACAERFMKNMQENKEEKLSVAQETKPMTVAWAALKPKNEMRSLHVSKLNEANATEEALRDVFGRFGTIDDVVVRTDREPFMAWVVFAKSADAESALAECDPVEDAPEGKKLGTFVSSVDGSTLTVAPSTKIPKKKAADAPNTGKGGPSRGGRDDWSKYRNNAGTGAGRYGGGLAPRGSWSGRAAQTNTMPVILPTGQVAYAMMGGGGRGNRRGGGRRDNRHRPY